MLPVPSQSAGIEAVHLVHHTFCMRAGSPSTTVPSPPISRTFFVPMPTIRRWLSFSGLLSLAVVIGQVHTGPPMRFLAVAAKFLIDPMNMPIVYPYPFPGPLDDGPAVSAVPAIYGQRVHDV